MKPYSHRVRVYIEDTDAGGIVFYVNYLKYMERARTELMRQLGYGKAAIFDHELMFVVAETQIKYLKPAVLDDELRVTAEIVRLRAASLLFQQCIYRGEEEICRGTVQIACVDRHNLKPSRIPDDMLSQLKPETGE